MLFGWWCAGASESRPRAGVELRFHSPVDVTARRGGVVVVGRGPIPDDWPRSSTSGLVASALDSAACALASDGERLLLSRGLLGGGALFYTRANHGRDLYACSEVEPLLAVAPGARHVRAERLAAGMVGLYARDRSAHHLEGIDRLDAGEALLVGPEGVTRTEARPVPLAADWLTEGDADLAAELRRLVDQSIRRAVAQARRVAVYVGGLDSSALLASLVAQQRGASRREIDVLTSDIAGPTSDAPYVDELCAAYGIVPLHVEALDASSTEPSSFVVDASPAVLTSAEVRMAGHARERGADVVLTGSYGDEIFGGELQMLGTAVFPRAPLEAVRTALTLKLPRAVPTSRRLGTLIARPLVRSLELRVTRRARQRAAIPRAVPWATPRLLDLATEALDANAEVRAVTHRSPSEYLAAYATSQAFLEAADWQAQAESVTRLPRVDPFLDLDLVRFALCVRPDRLHTGGIYRGLLREAMKGSMPERVRLRTGKGDPAAHVAATVLDAPSLASLRSGSSLARAGLVDPIAFSSAFSAAKHRANPQLLLQFLAGEAFLRWAEARWRA